MFVSTMVEYGLRCIRSTKKLHEQWMTYKDMTKRPNDIFQSSPQEPKRTQIARRGACEYKIIAFGSRDTKIKVLQKLPKQYVEIWSFNQ